MKTRFIIALIVASLLLSCKEQSNVIIIGAGQMPMIALDNAANLHVVYGKGDSIMYSLSADNGKSFSAAQLVGVLPQLVASHMRGPQIAATSTGITIIACDKPGNIFSYYKDESGKWSEPARINDVDTVSKEGLMALGADGKNTFAAWLDLRDKHNKIAGAQSADGGKTWSKNIIVYASPDTSVCECCKPSVAVKGEQVYVMFRNWLQGNRDLYLIQSADAGNSFGIAKKLGNGSWALSGCPMDGGGLIINDKNIPETIWRRNNNIYICEPGQPEVSIGEGKSCTIESVNGKNVYAWTENGEIVVHKPQGMKKSLGKGQLPVIKRAGNEHLVCIWENEKQIHAALVSL